MKNLQDKKEKENERRNENLKKKEETIIEKQNRKETKENLVINGFELI